MNNVHKENTTIRKLTIDEYEHAMDFVFKVFNESEAINYSMEGITEFLNTIHNSKFLSSLDIYGAFDNDELIGLIATRDSGSHIALFFVVGKQQRKGIGKQLFSYILPKTDSRIITVNSSIYARRIYNRLGFRETDSEKNVNGIRFIPMEYLKDGSE